MDVSVGTWIKIASMPVAAIFVPCITKRWPYLTNLLQHYLSQLYVSNTGCKSNLGCMYILIHGQQLITAQCRQSAQERRSVGRSIIMQ
jgi:hypothetical protein